MSKTKFLTLSMIALLAITSISCSKDDEPAPAPVNTVVVNPPTPTPIPTPSGAFVIATIDGVPFANDLAAQAFKIVAGSTTEFRLLVRT